MVVSIMTCMLSAILYCIQMCLKNLEISVLKYMDLILLIFLSSPGLAWQAFIKKSGVNLKGLTDIDMLLMVEEGIRGEIYHVIHRYAKANNEYMNNCDKSIESSYLMYLDGSNLYGLAISQKLPINGFKWVEK